MRARVSGRLPEHGDVNGITRALQAMARDGHHVLDLTASNPTVVGLPYPSDLLDGLGTPRALRYAPAAAGLRTAREAVAADAARRGATIDPDHLVLSASTSEAYSWLFKLLCDPGDAVLIPRPSYPLFEHLSRLEAVRTVDYGLQYHGRWEIDWRAFEEAPADTRAVVLVSPNNPTGSYISERERTRLERFCRDRGWAIIADEVFAEYTLETPPPVTDLASRSEALCFSLGGASKQLGLPQVKLAWIHVGGPADDRRAALAALEVIADTFLSVSTPVQEAAAALFTRAAPVRDAIQARTRRNLVRLRDIAREYPACSVPLVEGGWSAAIRVPATRSEEALVLALLHEERILVHPGFFFDFPHEAYVVVSLLPREADFEDGCRRLLALASRGCGV